MIGTLLDRMADPALNDVIVAALAKFGDRIVGTLRDYVTDEEMPAEVRREIPKVLQEIGTRAAQSVLVETVLDRDVILRYHTIAAINRLGQAHPDRGTDRKLIESVLAAEVMGHYRSYQVLGTLGVTIDDPTATALPAGWGGYGAEDPVTFEPVLPAGRTFASVLASVDEIRFTTYEPGYFFGFTNFDLRFDNIVVASPVPEPTSLAAAVARPERRSSHTARRPRRRTGRLRSRRRWSPRASLNPS